MDELIPISRRAFNGRLLVSRGLLTLEGLRRAYEETCGFPAFRPDPEGPRSVPGELLPDKHVRQHRGGGKVHRVLPQVGEGVSAAQGPLPPPLRDGRRGPDADRDKVHLPRSVRRCLFSGRLEDALGDPAGGVGDPVPEDRHTLVWISLARAGLTDAPIPLLCAYSAVIGGREMDLRGTQREGAVPRAAWAALGVSAAAAPRGAGR